MKPLVSAAQELEQKTRMYWNLSMIWNGRSNERLSCSTALGITRTLTVSINPVRPLFRSVTKTEDEIIRNQRQKKKKTPPENILIFPQAQSNE